MIDCHSSYLHYSLILTTKTQYYCCYTASQTIIIKSIIVKQAYVSLHSRLSLTVCFPCPVDECCILDYDHYYYNYYYYFGTYFSRGSWLMILNYMLCRDACMHTKLCNCKNMFHSCCSLCSYHYYYYHHTILCDFFPTL